VRAIAAALSLLAACAEGAPRVEPILEVPPPDSAGHPWDRIDELRLSVGRVGEDPLVEAAFSVGEPLSLTEVPFGRDLVVQLSGRLGGVEAAYGLTCTIDVAPDGASERRPRLWFSRIVRWGRAPEPVPRVAGHAYLLPDGSALFLGGSAAAVERFDARSTGDFASVSVTAPPIARTGARLVPVADGLAFLVGGLDPAGEPVSAVELFDPRPQLVLELDTVSGPALVEHAAASLVDGSAIVAGGLAPDGAGGLAPTAAAWRLRPPAGDLLESPRELAARLGEARAGHSMTRLGDEFGADVLVVGGRGGGGEPIAEAELYRPLREAFETLGGAVLDVPRWGHQALRMAGGVVLIAGGLAADPGGGDPIPVADLELYDPVQRRFSPAGRLPPGAGLTENTVTRLPDGRLLLAGGRDAAGTAVASAYIASLDPVDGRVDVSPTDDLATARAGHAAVLLCDGTVLVAGGGGAAERYNPTSAGRR
jgi:hypothetical protein